MFAFTYVGIDFVAVQDTMPAVVVENIKSSKLSNICCVKNKDKFVEGHCEFRL